MAEEKKDRMLSAPVVLEAIFASRSIRDGSIDDITTPGMYTISNMVKSPFDNYSWVIVIGKGHDLLQIAIQMFTLQVKLRSITNGHLGEWIDK